VDSQPTQRGVEGGLRTDYEGKGGGVREVVRRDVSAQVAYPSTSEKKVKSGATLETSVLVDGRVWVAIKKEEQGQGPKGFWKL